MSSEAAHQFIVVEGPIGVGKTSLARRLCVSLSAQGVLEQAAQNPFLERFYRDTRRYALPTQLFFLFQRVQLLGGLGGIAALCLFVLHERRTRDPMLPLDLFRSRNFAVGNLATLNTVTRIFSVQ